MEEERLNKNGNMIGMNSGYKSLLVTDPSVRGHRGMSKLNREQRETMATMIIEWILEGHTNHRINELIVERSPVELLPTNVNTLFNYALAVLQDMSQKDAPKIVAIHVGMYERIYKYFNEIDFTKGMLAAMKGKETLLGLLKKPKVVVNLNRNITITREVEYDKGKLNEVESARVDELMNKMKV